MTDPAAHEAPVAPPVMATGGAALLSPPEATSADVIQQQTSAQDYVVLRFAVLGLLLGVSISLIGVLVLAFVDKAAPEGVLSIGSACVGALATMLVRPPLFPAGKTGATGATGARGPGPPAGDPGAAG